MIIEKPTGALRFVERISANTGEHIPILQQQWRCSDYDEGKVTTEWRDVPLVEEEWSGTS